MAQISLQGRRILVVEDDYLIALGTMAVLEEAGADVLGPIGRVEEAVDFILGNVGGLNGAVVDFNLHGEKAYPVADALRARAIPFVFTTGYGADAVDPRYEADPRCEKPVNEDLLLRTLAEAKG